MMKYYEFFNSGFFCLVGSLYFLPVSFSIMQNQKYNITKYRLIRSLFEFNSTYVAVVMVIIAVVVVVIVVVTLAVLAKIHVT